MKSEADAAFEKWCEEIQTIDEFFALLYPEDNKEGNKEGNKEESNKNKKLKVGLKNDY